MLVFSLKGDGIHVHKNLAFNMAVVQLIFMLGADQTENKVKNIETLRSEIEQFQFLLDKNRVPQEM